MSLQNAHAKSIQRGVPPQSKADEDAQLNGAEGEEEYCDDSDSSDDDERVWNTSSAPSATATPPAIKTSGPDDAESSTLGPSNRGRRPNLTLTISPLVDVLDHLQDFFPDHDLDKPFIDQVQIANEGLQSSGGEALPPPTPVSVSKEAMFKHRKSIRFVAEERKKVLERVGSAREPSAKAANLERKKSTKLWGIRVEEVTPGQVKRGVAPTVPESPTGPAPRSTINEGLPSSGGEALPPPAPVSVSKEAMFKHRKSIRFVAEERKKVLERVGSAREPSAKTANLERKKSTKLWGIRVEEVTPGQVKRGVAPTVPESPTGPAPRPTIKWVKGELIGKGTYGKVYLAFNVTTGEMMAVKQVEMPQTISDQDDVRQVSIVKALESEQQTLEKLDHPNIVQYLGFEKTKEFFSVFFEYVPGGTIGGCLRRHGKFEENIIKSFTSQIIDGLAYLHANKIIHRDIKADNLLVDPSGNCKISDFGISKQSEEIYNNAAMTAVQGSPFWMAPEMLHNDKKVYSAKIDIWSLGCVFIEMFAGRRPWGQDDFVSVMFKVGHNQMAPPVPSDVHLSAEAEDFRLKCFTLDPNERPTAEGLKSHPWLDLPPGWIFPGFH